MAPNLLHVLSTLFYLLNNPRTVPPRLAYPCAANLASLSFSIELRLLELKA